MRSGTEAARLRGRLTRGLLASLLTGPVLAQTTQPMQPVQTAPLAARIEAARQVAMNAAECRAAQPFYWELGDARQTLASGQVGAEAPGAQTPLALASASKWLYAAYVVQQRHGQLSEEDIRFLSFRSGYSRFRICRPRQTVAACQAGLLNGRGLPDPDTVGKFAYSGGHMQEHAVRMGLGDLDKDGLAQAVRQGLSPLGADWPLRYSQAQPAGGGIGTPADYARFLRGILTGTLGMRDWLGKAAVCTNPRACPQDAARTPIPDTETWHYAIGHWVEDDPRVGDGAFSSPGAFGFYPWIDASKHWYGIVARDDRHGLRARDPEDKPAVESVACGRRIRKAWLSASAPAPGKHP